MTWTTTIESGSGNYALWLEIIGFGVFGSVKHTPTDSWCDEYSTEGRVYPWLQLDSITGWREEIDFLDASLKVTGVSPRIADIDGGMTALFRHYRGGAYTRLGVELTSAATTATVDDASEFDATGMVWIGGECCKYSGKTASSFTGLTRGYLNTEAALHEYDVDVLPPRRPVVGDNVAVLTGRRAYLHFASFSHATGAYSATEIIYRGRVKKGVTVSGGVYTIPIEHISNALNQKVARGLGAAKLKPNEYRYAPVSSFRKLGGITIHSSSVARAFNVTITSGPYSDGSLLREIKRAWEAAFTGYSTESWYPWVDLTGDKPTIRTATSVGDKFAVAISKYDPMWAIGFEEGTFSQNLDTEGAEHEASRDPFAYMADTGRGGQFDIVTDGDREQEKITTRYAYIPGETNVALYVISTNSTGSVTVSPADKSMPENLGRDRGIIESKDKKNLVLKEAVRIGGRIDSIIKQLFGLVTKYGTLSKHVARGVLATDFDFDELTDLLLDRTSVATYGRHLITKETEVQAIVGPMLAIIGACPRITDEGKIGFTSFGSPTAVAANDVAVDGAVWANIEAAKIASAMNATPLVNSITVAINKDFQLGNEPGDRITCFNIDALNELGESRQLNYDTIIMEHAGARPGDIAERLNELFVSLHFPIFGRESVVVEIPCNWKAKQIKCGDIVRVTHELIYDTPRGTIGVSGAMGLVTGRKLSIASGHDVLRVRIFAGSGWPAIAPTAKATTYNSTSAYLECSDISLYSAPGENDLTYFNTTAAVNVLLRPYNATGSNSYLATVTSVDEGDKRLYFSTKPLTTAEWTTAGMWVTFADWDNRTASVVDGFAYIADSSAPPSLGTSTSQYHRWGA